MYDIRSECPAKRSLAKKNHTIQTFILYGTHKSLSKRIADRHKLAEYFSLTVGRITQLTREGVLVKVSRGRYNAPESLERFINFKIQGGQSGTGHTLPAIP